MKFHILLLSSALLGTVLLPLPTLPALAQAPNPILDQGDVSVGRIDPTRPIRIEIVNGGELPIAAALTQPPSAERVVAPGSQIAFGTTNASYLPLPINLLVYPERTNIGLSVDVLIEGNVVTVVVGTQLSDQSGTINLSIDTDGDVSLI